MKKISLTYLTFFIAIAAVLAQELNTKTIYPYREIKLTNIQFSIEDTIMPYSLLVEPSGRIDFEEGSNFSYAKIGLASYYFHGKGKNKETFKDTMVLTSEQPTSLSSYFPPLNQDSTKFINAYEFDFEWHPHYEYEITYSYILNGIDAIKLYHSDMDSIVRIVVHNDGIENEIHNIYTIDLKKHPLEIQYIKTHHHYNGEFEILEKGTSLVSKQKQIDAFYTEFNKFNFATESHFIKVDGSIQYFIEFKTHNNYFAGMRHYRDDNGNIPENTFPWTVHHLYLRNYKRK